MSLFLSVVSLSEAQECVRSIAGPVGREIVPLEHAYNRVLAEDVTSDIDIPGFPRSVVDGYALASADTTGAGEAMPAMLGYAGRQEMGAAAGVQVVPGSCLYVPTGGVLPEGADAVAMIEYCEQIGDQVLVRRPVAHGENIISRGEDFAKGRTVLRRGVRLRPQECGVLAATGCTSVPVMKPPRIAVISTGNEVVPPSVVPEAGQVRDVNTYLCSAFLTGLGCTPVLSGIIADDRGALESAVKGACAGCDAVLVSGGSSKDMRDNTALVISDLGEVLVHGIAMAPGKPTIIGVADGVPVIGLPGHPASAYVVLSVLVHELIAAMLGTLSLYRTTTARLAQNVPSAKGREEYVRVMVEDGEAIPVFGKSGLINTLSASSGVIRVLAGSEGLEEGEEVRVILW